MDRSILLKVSLIIKYMQSFVGIPILRWSGRLKEITSINENETHFHFRAYIDREGPKKRDTSQMIARIIYKYTHNFCKCQKKSQKISKF